jgi:hypothetical protein
MLTKKTLRFSKAFAIFILIFFQLTNSLYAQNMCLSFERTNIDTARSNTGDVIIPIKFQFINTDAVDSTKFFGRIKLDSGKTNINYGAFSIDFASLSNFSLTKYQTAYLIVKQDSLNDRKRTITFELEIFKINTDSIVKNTSCQKSILTVNLREEKNIHLDQYEALTYLGSNFDLASSKVFQDLFFALNVLKTPKQNDSRSGMLFSIYGNTTMAEIDSNSSITHSTKQLKLSDSSYRLYSAQSDILAKTQAQNVGTQVIYLFRTGKKHTRDLQLLLSWSNEFIWRRNTSTSEYRNSRNYDSTNKTGFVEGSFDYISNNTTKYNEFYWNTGPGLFVVYENNKISMRIWANVGWQGIYLPESARKFMKQGVNNSNWFFSGKAYVTEPKTGVTLQVDVQNTLGGNNPYFGATLSKAFDLGKLAGFLGPLNQ